MKKLTWFLLLCVHTIYGQDSLKPRMFKIFDINGYFGGTTFQEEKFNLDHVSQFSEHPEILSVPEGSEIKSDYPDNEFVAGMTLSLRLHLKKDFYSHIKPRIGLRYGLREIFNYYSRYYASSTIDTLKFTNPTVAPRLIDSNYTDRREFSYITELIYLEIGANIDLFTLRYFNFYTGFLYSQGLSYYNAFTYEKEQYYSKSPYPGQIGSSHVPVQRIETQERYPSSSSYCVSVPVGVQHRFSKKHLWSLGLFVEGRFSYITYHTHTGPVISKPGFTFTAGFRFAFDRFK